MSTIDSDYSSSDYVSGLEAEDRFSFLNVPFSTWVVIKLSNSDLYPQNYKLRAIEDKGSIADSLTNAKIDLFDRTPIKENWFIHTLKKIAVFALVLFATPVYAFNGALFHSSMALKHLALSLWSKNKQDAAHHWEKVVQSMTKFIPDLMYSLFAIGGLFKATDFVRFIPALVVGAINGAGTLSTLWLARDSVCWVINGEKEDLYKSMYLRREFGITSKTGGCLTNWDPVKDKKDVLFTLVNGRYYYRLNGYFGNLHMDQGKRFVKLMKELKNRLPETCKVDFSYPPSAKKIADFLEMNKDQTKLSATEIAEWKQKFSQLSTEIDSIKKLLSEEAVLISKGALYLDLRFPLDEASYQAYLKEGDTQKI